MRTSMVSPMRECVALAIAMIIVAGPAAAQQGARSKSSGGAAQCQGCDSAQRAAAQRRWVDSEIAALTMEVARNRILYENLKSRLAADSPEPPRSDKEREELQARLAAQSKEMGRLMRDLSARCGEQEPVRGYIGVSILTTSETESSVGRIMSAVSYPFVKAVEPESPAARAGIMAADTIIAINRYDPRGRSLEQFVREPGTKLNVTIGRDGVRRDVTVIIGSRPPTFGGACMQYRDFRFSDVTGQSVVMFRNQASATGTVVGGGVVRDSGETTAFIMFPPAASGGSLFLPRGGSGAIVAGAEVSLVNGGLKAIFAVEYGALVLNVAPRSPAQQAGIIEGDVIVRANGEAITTIGVLQRAIQAAHEKRNVALDVIRSQQPKKITLRW